MSKPTLLFAVVVVSFLLASPGLAQAVEENQPLNFGVLQYRHVPPENVEEFVHLETTYWSEVARKAITDGKMVEWELWQKVGGWNLDEGSNFLFVNIFEKREDLDHINEIWNPSEVFPDVRVPSIDTGRLSTVKHQMFVQAEAVVREQRAQFIRLNYAKASDLARYVELEKTVWQPFITERMNANKTDVTSWAIVSVLIPSGASIPFNAYTVDGFQTLSGAISPSFDPDTEFPDFTELNEVHTKDRILTYALVKRVSGDQ